MDVVVKFGRNYTCEASCNNPEKKQAEAEVVPRSSLVEIEIDVGVELEVGVEVEVGIGFEVGVEVEIEVEVEVGVEVEIEVWG